MKISSTRKMEKKEKRTTIWILSENKPLVQLQFFGFGTPRLIIKLANLVSKLVVQTLTRRLDITRAVTGGESRYFKRLIHMIKKDQAVLCATRDFTLMPVSS